MNNKLFIDQLEYGIVWCKDDMNFATLFGNKLNIQRKLHYIDYNIFGVDNCKTLPKLPMRILLICIVKQLISTRHILVYYKFKPVLLNGIICFWDILDLSSVVPSGAVLL